MLIYIFQFIRTVDDEELEQFMYQCSYCNMVQLEVLTQDILLRNLNVAYLLQVKGEWDCSHCGGSMALVRDKGRNAEY